MNEKQRFRLFVVILAAVVIGGAFFVVGVLVNEDVDGWWIASPLFLLIAIAVVAVLVARKRLQELKRGIPSEDERSTALKMRAGHISFFASMYLCLALGWLFGLILEDSATELPSTGTMMFVLVAAMGVIYIVTMAVMSRGKGMP